MTDPFSIIVGTAGLADVCVRLTRFIKHARHGIRIVDQELDDLSAEILSLKSINDLVARSFTEGQWTEAEPGEQDILYSHWKTTQITLSGCTRIVEQIEDLLKEILETATGKYTKVNQLRKWLKQHAKDEDFASLRTKLKDHQNALQLALSALGVIYSRRSQKTSNLSYSVLSRSIQDLEWKIDSLDRSISISENTELGSAIKSAREVAHVSRLNKHFFAPQTVSSNFVGREAELNLLSDSLFVPSATNRAEIQKRFIIFGLAGSGKTQFCCKFALDNKPKYQYLQRLFLLVADLSSFWGIFWIDASSKEHAEQSFSTIADIGKVAPNQAAAKSWLSSLGPHEPWLLIIDNADETDFPVESYFPDSNIGTILVTTRNPMLKIHGTVGPRCLEFHGLDEAKSIDLLLHSANESLPWVPSAVASAGTIAKTLGYLPLALIHAGKTILARLCTLDTYLDFFDSSWARIRAMKEPNNDISVSDTNAAIYSSYELILRSISEKKTQAADDALDLLKILAFFDRQHIRLDIFSRAALNPAIEQTDRIQRDREAKAYNCSGPMPTWRQTLHDLVVRVVSHLFQLGHRPILPKLLIETSKSGFFDDFRLRQALNELFQMSLISTSSGKGDCYSMHAAVHLWARQRPEMTLAEQAVWCQVASTILSQSILAPPLGDTEEDEIYRRDVLPHVHHVQQVEQRIEATLRRNRESRRSIFPILPALVDKEYLLQLVKFSLVYAQGGRHKEAEKLQLFVADVANRYLGPEHMSTINITRLLSRTYWQLAQIDEAVRLQKRALDSSIKLLGTDNPGTLEIMDQYGSCLWLQGRIPESRKVHSTVVDTLLRVLGEEQIQTLKALGGLGRAVGKDFDFTEAINIQLRAFTGLKTKLGPSHSATLEAMDNLAMAYFDRAAYRRGQPGDLDQALELESEVFSMRLEKLGREHYHTLWSGLNLSRIKAISGEVDDALALFLPGHNVIRRDLGETHFIYLFGELHHGRILMCAGRYPEAEQILLNVISSHQKKRNRHPDRLLSLFSLIKCRNVLDKDADETATLLQELAEGTKALFGPSHAAVEYLLDGSVLSKDTRDVLDKPTSV